MEGYQCTDETIRVCGKRESFVERSQSAIIDVDKLKGWVNDAFDPNIKEFVSFSEQMGEPHSNVHFSSESEMAKPDKAGCEPFFFLHHTFLDYLWAY